MAKKILKLILLTLAICVNCAAATFALPSHQAESKLTVKIANIIYLKSYLPEHDFSYEMTIPATETVVGDPLTGLVQPHATISSDLYRIHDDNNIEVDLKIADPAMGARSIWKGKITYDKLHHTVVSVPEFVDTDHYDIHIQLTQPDQGNPQFFIKIMSY